NSSELAEQNPFLNDAIYKAIDPSGTEQIGDLATQLDPLGDDVGDEDPYLPDNGGDPGFAYPHFGDISDPGFGCTGNGVPGPCTMMMKQSLLQWMLESLRLSHNKLSVQINYMGS